MKCLIDTRIRRGWNTWLLATWLLPGLVAAGPGTPAACPATVPINLASLATPLDLRSGKTVASSNGGSDDAAASAQLRTAERASWERILGERSALTLSLPTEVPLDTEQRRAIEGDAVDPQRPMVGAQIALGAAFAMSGDSLLAHSARTQTTGATQVAGMGAGAGARYAWDTAIRSSGASALRLRFDDVLLAEGVELFVYNEEGQVWGPYSGTGMDASGGFWSPSVFGDTVRVHLSAPSAQALSTSRFTVSAVMHLGPRVGALQSQLRQQYVTGPDPDDVGYCGYQVPECTVNGVCAIDTNPGLANAANAIAHIEFVDAGSTYICTGAYVSQSGNAPKIPYFLTANHCFSTTAAASSVEAFFKYRTATCNGTCPTLAQLPRVNGSTLLATGARPDKSDFTFVRLSGFPAGGAKLLGWTTAMPGEGSYLIHMGHPAGSPLAYSYRRLRLDNSALPHSTELPEPTFLYSGLAPATSDWTGAVAGGSSGGPVMVLPASGDAYLVGQLFGFAAPVGAVDECDPAGTATIDGAFRSTFPSVRRYIYDKIFVTGLE